MKFFRIFHNLLLRKKELRKTLTLLTPCSRLNYFKPASPKVQCLLTQNFNRKIQITNDGNEMEDTDELQIPESEQFEQIYAKNLLFKNSSDKIMIEINNCASVADVLSILKKYENTYNTEHITQTILVLRDLQIIFYHYNNFNKRTLKDFITNLYEHEEFRKMLESIDNKMDLFNLEHLSYVFLYLFRMGISVEDELMETISLKLRDYLLTNFHLDVCSRFLRVIFSESSVRPYYISLELIPKVIHSIDTCDSTEELGHLTLCLNKLNNILAIETVIQYENRVNYFLKNKLKGSDYQTILKIIRFLNYPKWRHRYSILISDCILLMKNEINLMSASELLILYEVFFKNQEPGEVLNNIQRHSAKFLQHDGNENFVDFEMTLKLFSAFIYFSPPIQRARFRKDVDKYLKSCVDFSTLRLMKQVLSYVKVAEKKTCEDYWNISLKLLDESYCINNIEVLCIDYINFNTDLINFRSIKFERRIMELIEKSLTDDDLIFPASLSSFLSFMLLYGQNEKTLIRLIEKFEKNWFNLRAKHCLQISYSCALVENDHVHHKYIDKLKILLHNATKKILEVNDPDYVENSLLLKAASLRNDCDSLITEHLLYKYKELDYMSSKMLENIFTIFLVTNSIIPEVINKCTEYIVNYPDNVTAFNAGRILYLCYSHAYYPINDDTFFKVVTDIVIRDQERLSGLSFLQIVISLCFFNKVTSSFIKQIFNVEFMDKLDLELESCYSKDKYPQRVRTTLMQLNRVMCLEYPEFNVPWFHKKYVDEINKRNIREADSQFFLRVREYLAQIIGDSNIEENVITPYGYHIDFLINCNKKGQIIPPNSTEISKRLALLLVKPYAYTKFYIHLKGKFQLKNRHLEILGYEVTMIKFSEWINLLYGGERLEYLKNIIWPKKEETSNCTNKRLALLLVKPYAYTKFYIHLKGKFQLKNRHLEILGYEVTMIKFSEWINLLYGGERLEYLKNIIWPKKEETSNCTNKR